MTSFYKKLGIKQKFLLLFSIQIIIPLVFMGMMLYRTSTDIIQNKSIDYSVDMLKMIELRFNDFSDNVKVASEDLLYDPDVYEILQKDDTDSEITSEELVNLNAILRKICLSRDEIQAITLISNKGNFYTYDSSSGRANIERNLDYEELHGFALESEGQMTWKMVEGEGEKSLYVIRSIYNIDEYEELGLLVMQINLSNLEEVYANLSTEFMERISIVTQSGDFIIGTGQPTQIILSQLNELDETTVSTYWIDQEEDRLVCYRDVIYPAWRIVTEISLSKLNEDMNDFRNYFLIISAMTMLILSALSLFMAIDIIEPIKRLADGMRRMKKSKVHDAIIVDRKDELGYLGESFNDMSQEIDILVNQVYKEQLTRKEAELKTLQAQINPHFLFNTLESINWMARLNEVPEISDMVTALSSLMEAGIGKGGPMVLLREELDFVDAYILIMKNRYGDRLVFTKDVDRSVLRIKVPKLMLQPILENAIYHGIDKNRRTGEIHLAMYQKDEVIWIEITDNGKGMDQASVKALNAKLQEVDDSYLDQKVDHQFGIGLMNVNRRLKLFFGEDYGVQVESQEEAYTKVIISLPCKD